MNLFAVSDLQVLLAVGVGLAALWVVLKLVKALTVLLFKLVVILVVLAAVVWAVLALA